MTDLAIAGLMWTLVIVLVAARRAAAERSVLYAAIAIALAQMMNYDPWYVVVDGWFGARDIIHLASCILLLVGIFYFARAVTRAGHVRGRTVKLALGAPALIGASVLASIGFFLIDRHEGVTSLTLFATYGDQPATALYSSAQYVYIWGVMVAVVITATRQLKVAETKREKVTSSTLMFGGVCGATLAELVIVMDIAQVAAADILIRALTPLYYPFNVLTFLFLITGLIWAPITRLVRQRKRHRTLRTHLDRVETLWTRATEVRPSLVADTDRHVAHSEDRLHRRIVEIRDAALDGENGFELTAADRALLAEVEHHLLVGTA